MIVLLNTSVSRLNRQPGCPEFERRQLQRSRDQCHLESICIHRRQRQAHPVDGDRPLGGPDILPAGRVLQSSIAIRSACWRHRPAGRVPSTCPCTKCPSDPVTHAQRSLGIDGVAGLERSEIGFLQRLGDHIKADLTRGHFRDGQAADVDGDAFPRALTSDQSMPDRQSAKPHRVGNRKHPQGASR